SNAGSAAALASRSAGTSWRSLTGLCSVSSQRLGSSASNSARGSAFQLHHRLYASSSIRAMREGRGRSVIGTRLFFGPADLRVPVVAVGELPPCPSHRTVHAQGVTKRAAYDALRGGVGSQQADDFPGALAVERVKVFVGTPVVGCSLRQIVVA